MNIEKLDAQLLNQRRGLIQLQVSELDFIAESGNDTSNVYSTSSVLRKLPLLLPDCVGMSEAVVSQLVIIKLVELLFMALETCFMKKEGGIVPK